MADELPHPSDCEEIFTEAEISVDTSGLYDGRGQDPIAFTGKADLIIKYQGAWILCDFKSTKSVVNKFDELGYNYVKTETELRADPQAALYALHAMQKVEVAHLYCRWVYGQTKDKPKSAVTKFAFYAGARHAYGE
jgi:ATP-dependent exoDNAse (exonuclease V) beta subunit